MATTGKNTAKRRYRTEIQGNNVPVWQPVFSLLVWDCGGPTRLTWKTPYGILVEFY